MAVYLSPPSTDREADFEPDRWQDKELLKGFRV